LSYINNLCTIENFFAFPGVAFDPGVFYYPLFASGDNITISTDKIVINENMEVDTNSMDARCPYSTDFIWVGIEYFN
jgi:hypothetical protein